MKLYTEETIRNLIGRLDPLLRGNDWCELFDSLTPIELPSDEEIEYKSAFEYSFNPDIHNEIKGMMISGERGGFINGAKWVIEQIKQQDK